MLYQSPLFRAPSQELAVVEEPHTGIIRRDETALRHAGLDEGPAERPRILSYEHRGLLSSATIELGVKAAGHVRGLAHPEEAWSGQIHSRT